MAFHRARRSRVPAAAAVFATGVVIALVMAMSLSPARAQEQPPSAEQPKIEVEAAHPSEGSIHYIIRVVQPQGDGTKPPPDRRVTATAISPDGTAQAGVEFKSMGDGRYEGTVEIPIEQSWQVRFESPEDSAEESQPSVEEPAEPEQATDERPVSLNRRAEANGARWGELKAIWREGGTSLPSVLGSAAIAIASGRGGFGGGKSKEISSAGDPTRCRHRAAAMGRRRTAVSVGHDTPT